MSVIQGVVVAVLVATTAQAVPISTLFNTGVDASGSVLANGSTDSHYQLIAFNRMGTNGADPMLGSPTAFTSASGFPLVPGVWVGDNASSRWVGPVDSAGSPSGPVGYYDYRTSFDLTGFNPGSARIAGRWSADNNGVDILLNGLSLSAYAPGFQNFYDFAASSGFVAGVNTLDFLVFNSFPDMPSNYTGVRVEVAGTVGVPEPASLAVLFTGLAMAGAIRRRRA